MEEGKQVPLVSNIATMRTFMDAQCIAVPSADHKLDLIKLDFM